MLKLNNNYNLNLQMKKIVFVLCGLLAATMANGQEVIDNFHIGPYEVDYMGKGDVNFRLRKDINLYEYFKIEDNVECTPVIILDQFEEIYTLTEAEHKLDIMTFFQELSSLLNDIKPDVVIKKENESLQESEFISKNTTPVKILKRTKASRFNYVKQAKFRIVICLREDKLFLLERNCANIPSLKTNRFNLQELTIEGAMEVVMCPAKDLFTKENATNIVSNLSSVNDDGSPTVDPAILSLFLYKYYEKKGKANYDNVFSDYYKEATKEIREKSIFFLENHLLTLNGYRNQIPMDDALSQGISSDEIKKLLDK